MRRRARPSSARERGGDPARQPDADAAVRGVRAARPAAAARPALAPPQGAGGTLHIHADTLRQLGEEGQEG